MSDPRHQHHPASAVRAGRHTAANPNWVHPHMGESTQQPSTEHLPPPPSGLPSIDQGPPPSRHQEAVAAGHRLDIHLEHLQEDLLHERVSKNQKSKLCLKTMDSLRGLVKEVQDDDWKYQTDTPLDDLNVGITNMDRWGPSDGLQ